MTNISGMVVCAKRGGPTFMETKRVDPFSLKCPRGTTPCLPNSHPATVCLEEEKHSTECPIVDILIIYNKDIEIYENRGY